jgi:hypothetical protein
MSVEPLPRVEWDFDAIPREELLACCYWEYGRECISFLGYQLTQRKPMRMGNPDREKLLQQILNLIVAEGFDQEKFLERLSNTDASYSEFIHFLMHKITPLTRPWCKLPAAARAEFKKAAKETPAVFQPLRQAIVYELAHLWLENAGELKGALADGVLTETHEPECFRESRTISSACAGSTEKRDHTLVAFAVDFHRFSNAAILAAAADWLRKNRPPNCPEPRKNGKKLSDLRFDLKCLGVMRLLHRNTFEEIDMEMPEVWKSSQFLGAKWRDANKWYDARRRASKTYHELFPFLDPKEKPYHWQTKGERRKLGLLEVPAK